MIELMLPALVASLILVGIHGYLGIHIIARGVIFVDLALAQVAALGWAAAGLGLGAWVGGAIGLLISLSSFLLLATLMAFLEGAISGGLPYLPTCGTGKCQSGWLTDFGDFEWETDDQNRTLFRCRCGMLYWRDSKKHRVLEVLSDGSAKPFMVWKPFRGWKPDRRQGD